MAAMAIFECFISLTDGFSMPSFLFSFSFFLLFLQLSLQDCTTFSSSDDPPQINCPSDITVYTSSTTCSGAASWTVPSYIVNPIASTGMDQYTRTLYTVGGGPMGRCGWFFWVLIRVSSFTYRNSSKSWSACYYGLTYSYYAACSLSNADYETTVPNPAWCCLADSFASWLSNNPNDGGTRPSSHNILQNEISSSKLEQKAVAPMGTIK